MTTNKFGIAIGGKKQSAALNNDTNPPMVANGNNTTTSNYTHKITNVDRASCVAGERGERNQSKTTDMSISQKSQAGHHGKNLGLGNKAGLGGTHRHSLEKLKEYESQLLQNSSAHPSLNVKSNRESALEAQQ